MIRSPLRYPGGKTKLINSINKYFPEKIEEYYEPFFGGGSVGLFVEQKYKPSIVKVNDINKLVYYFWINAKNNNEVFVNELIQYKDSVKDGKKLFYECRTKINNNLASDYDLAISMFILNRISFSGLFESGGYSNNSFEKRFTYNSIIKIKQVHDIIANFNFTNKDFVDIDYTGSENTFTYLDPPYYQNKDASLYGKSGELHKKFSHEKLKEFYSNHKGKFLISYDNSPYIKKLYKDYNIYVIDCQYGMNNVNRNTVGKSKEIVITNY